MNSHWTNDNIDDDLYEAQEKIPVNIYEALNVKPPELYVFEEQLEQIGAFYEGAGLQSGPDLQLIHNMLHLVKDANSHEDISEDTENVIEMNKVNAKCIPANDNVNDIEKLFKKKKQRNVAIASLLEGLSNERISHDDDDRIGQVKLLKPEDFVLKSECGQVTEANNKCFSINGVVTESSAFIFNKKSPEIITRDGNERPNTEAKKSDAYQPSCMAELYYKKYLQRSKYKEIMQKSTEHVYEKIKGNKDFEGVQLHYHRHMLMTDCIVCNVICRKLFE